MVMEIIILVADGHNKKNSQQKASFSEECFCSCFFNDITVNACNGMVYVEYAH